MTLFHCEEPDCGKEFEREAQLTGHKGRVHGRARKALLKASESQGLARPTKASDKLRESIIRDAREAGFEPTEDDIARTRQAIAEDPDSWMDVTDPPKGKVLAGKPKTEPKPPRQWRYKGSAKKAAKQIQERYGVASHVVPKRKRGSYAAYQEWRGF